MRLAVSDSAYCVSCGEEIAARRLELDPTTPVCIDRAEIAQRGCIGFPEAPAERVVPLTENS